MRLKSRSGCNHGTKGTGLKSRCEFPRGRYFRRMKRRPIATRYAALVVVLLSAALVASGTVETWVSHRERQAALEALQREKAQAAANEVSRFVDDVLRNLEWVTLSAAPADDELERRRLDFLKLLRLEPAVTTRPWSTPRDANACACHASSRTAWPASSTCPVNPASLTRAAVKHISATSTSSLKPSLT